LSFACCTFPRSASAAPDSAPLVVELEEDAPVLDPAALRDAVARELHTPVVSHEAVGEGGPKATVRIDRTRGELTGEHRDRDGMTIVGHVALPADPAEALRTAVFLIGNLARDEAGDILHDLRPAPASPAAGPPPADAPNRQHADDSAPGPRHSGSGAEPD